MTFAWPFLNEAFFVDLGLFLVAFSALGYILQVLIPREWLRHLSTGILASAWVSLVTSLVLRSMSAQYFALSNMYEALLVVTIGFILAFLILERWFRLPWLGWVVALIALLLLFYAGTLPKDINPLQAALQSYWRSIHVPPLLLSYGFFTVSFISSIAYLIAARDERGTPLSAQVDGPREGSREGEGILAVSFSRAADLYDEVTYRAISAGLPLLIIGIMLGAVWANEAWGNYWQWDPKESMSLVTALGYGVYLHMRINGEHPKKTLAWVSVGSFLLMLMCFFGVNMWGFGSLHSYGIPTVI